VRRKRVALGLVVGALLLLGAPGFVAAGPVPPCAGSPGPAYGTPDGPPQAWVWTSAELQSEGWRPATCLGWPSGARLIAALASRFHATGDVPQRLSRISNWPSIRYWSISEQSWRPLALSVSALDSAGRPIGDVPAEAVAAGRDTLFVERDEHTGETTYRLRVLARSADRLVVATENVTPIRLAILTAFDPGALQTVVFLQREDPDLWSSYQITRVGPASNALVLGHTGSFLNRLEAVRRYLAGRPTEGGPPIAPR